MHIPFLDQWFVLAFIGLLLFGKRLPEVGRSIGKGIVEFKKGLQGIEEDYSQAGVTPPPAPARPVISHQPQTSYKFDPETGQPIQPAVAVPPGAKFDPYTGKPLNNETVSAGSQTSV